MGDRIIVTEEEPRPAKQAEVVVVTPGSNRKPEEKVVIEKTTITQTKVG